MERPHPKAQKASPPRQFDARFFIIPCTWVCYEHKYGSAIKHGCKEVTFLGPKDCELSKNFTRCSIHMWEGVMQQNMEINS